MVIQPLEMVCSLALASASRTHFTFRIYAPKLGFISVGCSQMPDRYEEGLSVRRSVLGEAHAIKLAKASYAEMENG